uniref:Uncharacterized protein TCIL3000_4_2190 n=1 Tax=Trypanosoma congolense (strain IL3000) TaxID=1068625 RepID=G0UL74_TRYCI|nr:unnamed protein product [Trypanosoma congolense IL3000]
MRFPPHNNNKNNCCYPYYYWYFKMIALSHCCPGGRLMNGDDEACVDLRRCWRTFMVDSADQSQRQEQGSDAKGAQHHLGHDELTLLRRYRVVGTEEDEQSLFFLSLISPNAELLRATSHLFTQLNFQFRQLAVENEGKVMLLRNYHEEQLTNLLEASNVEAGDMIVGSDITEHFVLKHQRELEELQQENCYTESVLMLELRENFFTFLKTSAHGTMDSLEHGAGWLKLRQDDEQRKHVANISSFCGPRFPVRVLELPNLLRKKLGGFRVKDPLLRPVVVDISPLANLRDCLFCLYAENQAAAQAVEEHLLRLSRQIHALLFFIGSEEEARSILTNKYAELFLTNDGVSPPKSSCRFVPLRHHPSLKIMLSTQFWGANIILLWSPAPHSRDASLEASIVEDVLSLALAWNVDMLSVAVLKSAAHSQSAAAGGPDEQGRDVAVEALRQL